MAASAALAAGLTERLQTERMTVVKVDRAAGQFQSAEHRRWMTVAKDSIGLVHAGDIVRVQRAGGGHPPRLIVLRSAAEELASPE